MNTRIATFLSVVFHPLIITTYLFAILFLLTPDLAGVSALELPAIGSLLLLLFLNTFVAPCLIVYYMYRLGMVSSLHVENLHERRYPYLAVMLLYAISVYLFGWKLQPIGELAPQISILLASVTTSLFAIFSVSIFWKISAHATGFGGFIAVLTCMLIRYDEPLLLIPVLSAIVTGGFVLSARLALNAHTLAQVVAGFACGLMIGSVTVFWFI